MGDFMSGVFAFCDCPCDHSMRKQTNLVLLGKDYLSRYRNPVLVFLRL
jgi:hypothetical protein